MGNSAYSSCLASQQSSRLSLNGMIGMLVVVVVVLGIKLYRSNHRNVNTCGYGREHSTGIDLSSSDEDDVIDNHDHNNDQALARLCSSCVSRIVDVYVVVCFLYNVVVDWSQPRDPIEHWVSIMEVKHIQDVEGGIALFGRVCASG